MSASRYVREALIGQGSFGEVWRATDKETGETVAVKAVDLEAVDEEIEVIQREIHVMCLLDTPYVVRYHTSYIENTTLYIIMEFMQYGSLRDLIDLVGPLPEQACAYVIKCLLGGLAYIHKESKLHRDVKSANTLLNAEAVVKLADFGVAASVAGTIRKRTTCRGSPLFMAPEVISSDDYGAQADIWSLGITAIECAQSLPPLANLHPFRAMLMIPKNDPPQLQGDQFSSEFKDFVAACLRKDWLLRPSADELLEHPFIERAERSALVELVDKKETIEKLKNLTLNRSTSIPSGPNSPVVTPPIQAPQKHNAWDFTLAADIGIAFKKTQEAAEQADDKESKLVEAQPVADKIDSFLDGDDEESEREEEVASAAEVASRSLDLKVDSFLDDDEEEEDRIAESEPKDALSSNDKATQKADVTMKGGKTLSKADTVMSSEQTLQNEKSKVLTDLFLPVLSTIRGNLAAQSIENADALVRGIGALEVAFVDTEEAHPGISSVLLESLFKEALISPVPDVRSVLMKVLGQSNRG